jgi:probable F420-dependent oxidoreductase
MQFGLILPTKRAGANPEVILATAQTAERLGWRGVWADDHILVSRDDTGPYRHIYELITTMAWLGGQTSRIRLGTSVIVVPQRNAVITAKELATVDSLSGGRVVAGVGLGWNEREYRNLGAGDRFRVRGAFLDETIRLWRHLWSGSGEPFVGRFHDIPDAVMSPLPAQGSALPIIVGGRSEHGVARAGRLGDGYQLSQNGPAGMAARLPVLRAAAEAAGRPTPPTSARAQVYFGPPPRDATPAAIHGTPDDIGRVIDEWEALGLDELALDLDETDTDRAIAKMERLHAEVLAARLSGAG